MGSYGIGPARIAAAAVEQYADEHGISWPRSIAPFDVQLVALGKPGSAERELADRLYDELARGGLDVLYDDRDASPGEKFVEAELLGCPLRVRGRQAHARGWASSRSQVRRGTRSARLPLEGAAGDTDRAARRAALMPRLSRARTARPEPPRRPGGV